MSEAPSSPQTAPPRKEDPEALVLRGRPRPAVRFRRGLIVGITGAVAASLIALAWLALEPPSFRGPSVAVESDESRRGGAPDALADVPSSYGEVPRLGPPLPGDLGRPILEHRRELGGDTASPALEANDAAAERAAAAAEAERQRVAAAAEAARSSAVIVQLRSAGSGAAPVKQEQAPLADPIRAEARPPNAALPASQQRKLEFASSAPGDLNPHGLRTSPSPWTLSAGTVIPASLITGLNSDLPGIVIAQVTENVRDSATGRTILIPQGARLLGNYDSAVAFGQRRALLVWKRLVLPDGSSLELDSMPATDSGGYAGVADRVDFHTWQLLKGIALSTLLGVGTELSLGGESDLVRAIRESAQQNAARAGDQITQHNLDVQPTITVRPGWPLRAIVHKDLVLQPWRG